MASISCDMLLFSAQGTSSYMCSKIRLRLGFEIAASEIVKMRFSFAPSSAVLLSVDLSKVSEAVLIFSVFMRR